MLPPQDGEIHLCLRAVVTRLPVAGEVSVEGKDLRALQLQRRQLCRRDATVAAAEAGEPSDRTPSAQTPLREQAGDQDGSHPLTQSALKD